MFHICNCLMEQDEETQEKLQDLGMESPMEWTNLAISYQDISTYWDWVDEKDNVLGCIVITNMGLKFYIDTCFEQLTKELGENIKVINIDFDQN